MSDRQQTRSIAKLSDMAGPREVALGIASVLGKSGLPNPLLISCRGQTLDEAASIVEAIVSECDDAGVGIDKLELDSDLERNLFERGYAGSATIVACGKLVGEIRIYATPGN